MRTIQTICLLPVVLLAAAPLAGQTVETQPGIEPKLGVVVPLEQFTFTDESGARVNLKDLVDRPTVLTLVFFRCPQICTPLLQEQARLVEQSGMQPGENYRMVTVSFDPLDTAELAASKKKNLLGEIKRTVPPDAWRFLTAEDDAARRLANTVGFYYTGDSRRGFSHPAALIFLSSEGKVVRYLEGLQFTPSDLDMAVVDASQGREAPLIRRIQRLCFSYDPAKNGYEMKTNRVILGVTVPLALVFAGYLVIGGRRRRARIKAAHAEQSSAADCAAGADKPVKDGK